MDFLKALFGGCAVPTYVTILGLLYACMYNDGGTGYYKGLGNLLVFVPVSAVIIISWIIWWIFK